MGLASPGLLYKCLTGEKTTSFTLKPENLAGAFVGEGGVERKGAALALSLTILICHQKHDRTRDDEGGHVIDSQMLRCSLDDHF